jgi:ferritin
MLPKKIEEICNLQVEKEGYSSNLYLAMAAWAENQGYAGVAEWLYAQADEEKMHMLKFISYINERGGRVIIPAFQKPPEEYKGIKEMFDDILKHEQYISASINEIVALCIEEKDFTTHNWIQWFVAEQIEEESSVQAIIDKLNLVGDKNMYMFDRDIMGMRGEESEEE